MGLCPCDPAGFDRAVRALRVDAEPSHYRSCQCPALYRLCHDLDRSARIRWPSSRASLFGHWCRSLVAGVPLAIGDGKQRGPVTDRVRHHHGLCLAYRLRILARAQRGAGLPLASYRHVLCARRAVHVANADDCAAAVGHEQQRRHLR